MYIKTDIGYGTFQTACSIPVTEGRRLSVGNVAMISMTAVPAIDQEPVLGDVAPKRRFAESNSRYLSFSMQDRILAVSGSCAFVCADGGCLLPGHTIERNGLSVSRRS